MIFTFRDQSTIVQARERLIAARDDLEMQVELRTRELKASRDEAMAANEAKTRFLASMSHEIRTPMNVVIGMTELLMHTDQDEQQRELTQSIQRSGEHLLGLINNILDLSCIEAGRLKLALRRFDLHLLIKDCETLFRQAADAKALTLEVSLAPEAPRWLLGDEVKLRQILFNLLGNACKYTDAGGVSLVVESSPRGEDGVDLGFKVTDTGLGISDDFQAILFEEFTRQSLRDQDGRSSGLGLAITRRLCRLMGGDLAVVSRLGEGSCFTATIPFSLALAPARSALSTVKEPESADPVDLKANKPATSKPQVELLSETLAEVPSEKQSEVLSETQVKGLQGVGILVAEDGRVNQRMIELMLAKLGLKADFVADGQAAVERIEAGGIDLVFMDIQMPRLDGVSATRELRRRGFQGLYVIALTAYAFETQRQECQGAGMNDFLTKPVRLEDLAAALQRFRLRRGLGGLSRTRA
ncbi:response regulator [Synechococcus sp. CBW1107]|uniref:response regulator n=2 Tax=unclassified Synechococcus TaxID=2626047 RepID=UPI002AD2CED7|nr:response regulator [Synechococcus sp. CBW1107]